MTMRRTIFTLIVSLVLAACQPAATAVPTAVPATAATTTAPTAEPATLTVFAAVSLTDAFGELGAMFEADHPGVTVAQSFGASNILAEQINQGAPADVFASASAKTMVAAIDGGRIVSGTQRTFVRNRLVVIYPTDNPSQLASLQDLAKPGLKLVLAAQDVPVGQYALDFLDKAAKNSDYGAAYKDAVLANVVSYEENVRAVFTKVSLGEADAGIVYTSDVVGDGSESVTSLAIPDELNTIATYPIAPLKDAARPELAQAFIDMVLSAEGQAVLARYGFIPFK
jgi:molybdate transport system substrate-binding protein